VKLFHRQLIGCGICPAKLLQATTVEPTLVTAFRDWFAANYNAWTGVFPQSFLNSIDSAQPKNEERLAG